MVKGEGLLIVAVAIPAITWLVILLRFFTRTKIVGTVSWDDWAILATTLVFSGFCGSTFNTAWIVSQNGVDNYTGLTQAALALYSTFLLYIVSTLFLKLALMLFFLRFLIMPWQRTILFITTAIFTAIQIVYFFLILFDCHNPKHYLQNQILGHCLNKKHITVPAAFTASAINAATDCVYTALPISVIISSMMSSQSKRIVAALLGLGLVGCVCSIVRIPYLRVLNESYVELFDGAYTIGTLSVLELGLGIIAPSLATLRPLFVQLKVLGKEKVKKMTRRGESDEERTERTEGISTEGMSMFSPTATRAPRLTIGTMMGKEAFADGDLYKPRY